VIRIFALSVYALKVTTNAQQWEEFHSVAGEIMFLPWLFIFLLIVTVVETKRLKRLDAQKEQAQK
jgi:thaumarchaeosortase